MVHTLPLVQLHLLRPILTALHERGIDPEPVLETVGLTASAVQNDGAAVHVMVVHQFLENCAAATGDKTFCATVGRDFDTDGWPMLRKASNDGNTLVEFLNIYVIDAGKVASSVTPYINTRGDRCVFGEKRHFRPSILPAQNDGFMSALYVTVLERVLRDKMDPDQVVLTTSNPSVLPDSMRRYRALKGDMMGISLQFPSAWLMTPLPPMPRPEKPEPYVQYNRDNGFLTGFRELVQQNIGKGGLRAEEVAALVHMSPRRLSRQLSRVGTTISEEVRRAKMDHAKTMLAVPGTPVEEIAATLGYSDPSNFTRAFTAFEKMTPTAYRKLILSDL